MYIIVVMIWNSPACKESPSGIQQDEAGKLVGLYLYAHSKKMNYLRMWIPALVKAEVTGLWWKQPLIILQFKTILSISR